MIRKYLFKCCLFMILLYCGSAKAYGINKLWFKNEPSINKVQEMAIKYAEVSPEKIKLWRKQAAIKALLPRVTFGIDNSSSDTYEIYTNSTKYYAVNGPKDCTEGWDLTFSWDLSDIVFADQQTAIDVRSKLMVQLRERILVEVTKIYFARMKIIKEIQAADPEDTVLISEKELMLYELTAYIDAYTGGEFSKCISQ